MSTRRRGDCAIANAAHEQADRSILDDSPGSWAMHDPAIGERLQSLWCHGGQTAALCVCGVTLYASPITRVLR